MSEIPELNLLGQTATKELGISVDHALNDVESCHAVFSNLKANIKLQEKCKKLCNEFKDLWKPELGCLKDFELEIKFKPNVQPIFRKARPVPFAMEADLEEEYKKGITKGVWEATQFCQFRDSSGSYQEGCASRTKKTQDQSLWGLFCHSQPSIGGSSAYSSSP